MKNLFYIVMLFLSSSTYASDMGNGEIALGVWGIGGIIALFAAFLLSRKKDANGVFNELNKSTFFGIIIIQLPLLFILGITAAIFW